METQMQIDTMVANSLSEYFYDINIIAQKINKVNKNTKTPPVLWFRGLNDMQYSLIPSIMRTETRVKQRNGDKMDYSSLHYAEDIRTQHYIAKNYHFFQKEPSSRVEWLEVMQHHQANTRVLDWSESSMHSLLFAIEMFLDNVKYNQKSRDDAVPCVWILEPAALNKKIFKYIENHLYKPEIAFLFKEITDKFDNLKRILKKTKSLSNFSIYDETSETSHMDYILNLSSINDEILRDRGRIEALLLNGDIINPYYYLISRIYSDGHILQNRELPPLAIVHPYHSERIKAQHGVFTIFPFYKEQDEDEVYRGLGINPDAMEKNKLASDTLHQIVIGNPRQIAYELMQNGMNDSWLYPEMPVITNEIERHHIY